MAVEGRIACGNRRGGFLKRIRKQLWIFLIVGVLALLVGCPIVCDRYVEKDRELRTQIREIVRGKYPVEADEIRSRYGIKPAGGKDYVPGRDNSSNVILVHGLDDPGKVWMNLAPVLAERGFRVWFFNYPNDQPIEESAALFHDEMALMRQNGPETLSIVAHSMGGLVTRDMLTRPEFDYSGKVADGRAPKVSRLIMVGTPNHGSALARFRIFAEFREQMVQLFRGDYVWLQSVLDGAGEAGLDLTPGSPFLKRLNSRPHPEDVSMVVIAGMMQGGEHSDIDTFISDLKDKLPDTAQNTIDQLEKFMSSMAQGLGDGLVPVDSAKLDGVPLHIVPGTHLSIIRNISKKSSREPPAIPIILEYLNSPS